jgi:hypothetical protein
VPVDRLPPAQPGEGAYAASGTNVTLTAGHIWIGTTAGRVRRSADDGRTWTIAATGLATGGSAGIFSVAFRDALHGVVVGGDYQKESAAVDNAAWTSDGGATWTLVKSRGLSGFRSVVAFVSTANRPNATALIAIGPTGADWSDDDGRTWTRIECAGFDTFSAAPGGHSGWCGRTGRPYQRMVRPITGPSATFDVCLRRGSASLTPENPAVRPSYLFARCSGIRSWATSWARSPPTAASPAADPPPSSPRLGEAVRSTARA